MARKRPQVKALSLVDVLEPLSEGELEYLAERCPDIHLQEGEEFYRSEEHDGGLFFIKEGRVRVYGISFRGKETTFALIGSGTVLTSRRLRGLHAQALEPSVLAFLPPPEVERLLKKKPEVGLRLVDLLAERLRAMDRRMSDVIHKRVPARLAALLLDLLDEEGVVGPGGREIPRPYTHEQLGTMIGARRVAVTRALGRLREAGAVETRRGRIRVADPEALERVAREGR